MELNTNDCFYKKFDNYKHHVVNIFSDNGCDIVTYKVWLKRRKRWNYDSEPMWLIEMNFEHKLYKRNKH